MARRNPVSQRQYLTLTGYLLQIDGSEVTTSDAKTGLVVGRHVATVKKGTSADSNLVTITLRWPYGIIPQVLFQPRTLDCECRLEEDPTKTVIKVRTVKSSDTTQKVDDADFTVLVLGTEDSREGAY